MSAWAFISIYIRKLLQKVTIKEITDQDVI